MKIKILIILLGLLLLIFMSPKKVQGQIAVKGGAALSGFQPWQDLSPFSGHDYRPFLGYEVDWLQHDDTAAPSFGLQFGVSYTRRLSKHFAVQPELFYSQRGVYFLPNRTLQHVLQIERGLHRNPRVVQVRNPAEAAVQARSAFGPIRGLQVGRGPDARYLGRKGDQESLVRQKF